MAIQRMPNVTFGCDPEAFFEKGGQIIGAEKVIPEKGLGGQSIYGDGKPSVVLDGVQFELNPGAFFSPRDLGTVIARSFKVISERLKLVEGVTVSFKPVVEVTRAELDSLSEKSRILGCAPSKNLWGAEAINVDPVTFQQRSAGGHVHLGLTPPIYGNQTSYPGSCEDNRWRLVAILDVLLGNTCVMLDRDMSQVERRKNYGRAGEFREPKHGLEYRTLSNFWLRNYALMEFVMGMAQFGADVLMTTLMSGEDLESELMDKLELDQVVEAINKNDFNLARSNWNKIKGFITKYSSEKPDYPFYAINLAKFDKLADLIDQKGIETVFPENPLTAWTKTGGVNHGAWRGLLANI